MSCKIWYNICILIFYINLKLLFLNGGIVVSKKVCVKDIPIEIKQKIAFVYVGCKYSTFDSIGKMFGFTDRMISNILYDVIVNDYVGDVIADRIIDKVIHCNPKGKHMRLLRWEGALELRDKNRLKTQYEIQECYLEEQRMKEKQIAFLEEQIRSFNDYFISEDGAPTKEVLINQLNSLKAANY